MNQIQTFNFNGSSIRTVTLPNGEPGFVGKDVAERLGYANASDAMKDHCRGVAFRYPILDSLGRTQEARILTEPDVLRLIVSSRLPEAEAFEKWVFEEVLPSIRKTGSYNAQPQAPDAVRLQMALMLAETACRMLSLEGSAKLGMMHTATRLTAPHLLPMLPSYAVDAPRDTSGTLIAQEGPSSSEPSAALTDLLKKHNVKASPVKVNKLLVEHGFLEVLTRPSRTLEGVERSYKVVASRGMRYGKNITNPNNPKEAQPYWFKRTFPALIEALGL